MRGILGPGAETADKQPTLMSGLIPLPFLVKENDSWLGRMFYVGQAEVG